MSSTIASVESKVVDTGSDGLKTIYTQRYDASGAKIGDPIQAIAPQGSAFIFSTTLLSDGKFVVAYRYTEPYDPWAPRAYSETIATSEFNADGTALTENIVKVDDAGSFSGIEVQSLSGGTYAYILRTRTPNFGEGSTTIRSLGFVDESGKAHETLINQDRDFFYDGNAPQYHPGEPTIKLLGGGSFAVSYNITYGSDFFSFPGQARPTPDPHAHRHVEKIYDAGGHLKTASLIDFDSTVTVERYDTASGEKVSARTTHEDGTRTDTQYGITGRSYAEQAVSYDADGHVTERQRYYGDAGHTRAFSEKFLADGTKDVHSYDTLGRETAHWFGDLEGTYDVIETSYVGDSDVPAEVKHMQFGPGRVKQFMDMTNADGTHRQTSLADGVTLTSHQGVADTFIALANGSDTFAFKSDFGHDVVRNFVAGGAHHDVLQFDEALFADASDLASHLRQIGGDTLISFDDGSSVLLKNVAAGALTADNVKIVHHDGLWA